VLSDYPLPAAYTIVTIWAPGIYNAVGYVIKATFAVIKTTLTGSWGIGTT
jgi:hypothetical protein